MSLIEFALKMGNDVLRVLRVTSVFSVASYGFLVRDFQIVASRRRPPRIESGASSNTEVTRRTRSLSIFPRQFFSNLFFIKRSL